MLRNSLNLLWKQEFGISLERRNDETYSTGRGKTGKTDAPIENELDIVRN